MTQEITKCGYRFKVTVEGIPSFLVARYEETQQPFTPDEYSNMMRTEKHVYNHYNIMLGVYASETEPMDNIIQALKEVRKIQVDFMDCEGNIVDMIIRDNVECDGVSFGASWDSDKPIMLVASYIRDVPMKRTQLNG